VNFLILQHLQIEPGAYIAELIEAAGHRCRVVRRDHGECWPVEMRDYHGVIVMGGPQSANDQTTMISEEITFVAQMLAQGMPMLGVCLGAQLMARAAGAAIIPSPLRELGWWPVQRTAAGSDDLLFSALPAEMQVFQWHGESFTLSDRMTLLATHPEVPAQAFRVGVLQYGMQFHLEVDAAIIADWIAAGASERAHLGSDGIARLLADTARDLATARAHCRTLVTAWLQGCENAGA